MNFKLIILIVSTIILNRNVNNLKKIVDVNKQKQQFQLHTEQTDEIVTNQKKCFEDANVINDIHKFKSYFSGHPAGPTRSGIEGLVTIHFMPCLAKSGLACRDPNWSADPHSEIYSTCIQGINTIMINCFSTLRLQSRQQAEMDLDSCIKEQDHEFIMKYIHV